MEKSAKVFSGISRFCMSLSCHVIPAYLSQCQDVGELLDNEQFKKRAAERKYILKVIRCLCDLGRQGIVLQGHDWNNNFTQLLCLLKKNLCLLERKIRYKYTHNNVQNKILDIMAFLTYKKS